MRLCITILSVIVCSLTYATSYTSNGSGDWNTATTWTPNGVPGSGDDVDIISGHAITLSADSQINNLNITNGDLAIGSNTFSIYGDLSGAQIDNLTSTANSILEINDSGSASAFTFPAGVVNLQKLIMNRSAGAITTHSIDLDDAVPADSIVLVLTDGIVYMNSGSILYMNSHGVKRDIPCSDASHIDGPVQRDIEKSSGMHIFPVGDQGHCRPMALQANNGTNNVDQIEFVWNTPPNSTNYNSSNLPGGIFQYYYWKHDNLSTTNMQRRLYFNDTDFPGLTDTDIQNSLYLANSDGVADWDTPVNPRSVDVTLNYVQFNNASAANDDYWTFGSNDAAVDLSSEAPLPITLSFFDAKYENGKVSIIWETASEINNDYFTIEKSSDGIHFNEFKSISGAGFSNSHLSYEIADTQPYKGISYYRIKQTDFNGDFSYSAVVEVLFEYSLDLKIFTKEGIVYCSISSEEPDEYEIYVFDASGNELNFISDFLFPNTPSEIKLYSGEEKILFITVNTNSLTKRIKYSVINK